MRIRLTLLGALVAVALSTAPAHASNYWISGWGSECESILPSFWDDPNHPWCPFGGSVWQ